MTRLLMSLARVADVAALMEAELCDLERVAVSVQGDGGDR